MNNTTWAIVIIVLICGALGLLNHMIEGFALLPVNENSPLVMSSPQPITTTGSVVPTNVSMRVNWRNAPAQQLSLFIHEFGLPDIIDVNQGGLALWKRQTLVQRGFCWNQVILRDLQNFFIEISYSYPLRQLRGNVELHSALDDLLDFNPAISYDQTTESLNAKGNSAQEVVVLLTLGKRLFSKEITLQQALNLLDPFLASIDNLSPNYDPNAYNKYKIELCSLGVPLANSLGAVPPNEIFTLKPGGLPKNVPNMAVDQSS